MTYPRVVGRNYLQGDYVGADPSLPKPEPNPLRRAIAGDLRRLEEDSLDDTFGQEIADAAGVDLETSRKVLTTFFAGTGRGWIPPHWTPPTMEIEDGTGD